MDTAVTEGASPEAEQSRPKDALLNSPSTHRAEVVVRLNLHDSEQRQPTAILATIAHEVRTPLTIVETLIELLRGEVSSQIITTRVVKWGSKFPFLLPFRQAALDSSKC